MNRNLVEPPILSADKYGDEGEPKSVILSADKFSATSDVGPFWALPATSPKAAS